MASLSALIIGLALALLAYIAVHDIRHYRISNVSVAGLALLFLIYSATADTVPAIPSHLIVATGVFLLMLVPFSLGWMGGGDVKILAVAFLWTGIHCAFFFSVVLAVCTIVHAVLVRMGAVRAVGAGRRKKVPFGPSAAVALAVTLVACIPRFAG